MEKKNVVQKPTVQATKWFNGNGN